VTFSICILDDDQNLLHSIKRIIRKAKPKWHITTYTNPDDALADARKTTSSIYLSDYHMESMSGVEFLKKMKHLHPLSIRILFSGVASDATLQVAINDAEIFRFINKPVSRLDLMNALNQAFSHLELQAEHRQLISDLQSQKKQLLDKNQEITALKYSNPALFNLDRDSDGAIVLNIDDD
jgi:two-component system probable response regulator PhcQ